MAIDLYPQGYSETACWDCAKEITPLEAAHVASITRKNRVECRKCAGTKLLNQSRDDRQMAVKLAVIGMLLGAIGVALSITALVVNHA